MAKKKKGWLSRLFGGKKQEEITEVPQEELPESAHKRDDSVQEEPSSSPSPTPDSLTDESDFEAASDQEERDFSEYLEEDPLLEEETEEILPPKDEPKAQAQDQQREADEAIEAVAELITPTASSTIEETLEDIEEETTPKTDSLEEEDEAKESSSEASTTEKESHEGREKPKKQGFFARLSERLAKTRNNLTEGIADLFLGKKEIDEEILEELETRLLLADVGINVTEQMLEEIRDQVSRKSLSNADELFAALKSKMVEILTPVEAPLSIPDSDKPYVLLMIGVNGVGKTTTIGKLAKKFQADGKSVMLAAGDTFRAAAVEQLEVWGERNQIPVISQKEGADPASVVFDAMESSKARKIDILIADTAGRLHTDSGLMQELAKINRVIKRHDESAPHEVMLVVDASTGQNALNQARQFNETVPLTGITFTKMDGTAKGGIIFAIADELKIPVRFIGVGEGIDDLRPFNAEEFVDALIGEGEV